MHYRGCCLIVCKYCNRIIGHDFRCPNYIPEKATHYCSFCGNGIYEGEEYIENTDGDFRHYECFYDTKDLLEWLGYEIKTMEEID